MKLQIRVKKENINIVSSGLVTVTLDFGTHFSNGAHLATLDESGQVLQKAILFVDKRGSLSLEKYGGATNVTAK